jgi:hypothetical protein
MTSCRGLQIIRVTPSPPSMVAFSKCWTGPDIPRQSAPGDQAGLGKSIEMARAQPAPEHFAFVGRSVAGNACFHARVVFSELFPAGMV